MAADVKIDIAAEFTGKKAFKQADTATQKLTGGVKKLAGAIGLAYSATRILAYGKASVKAAAQDEKAQKQLALALKNVGLGRDAATSEAYIQRLQSEFGILDDQLRPAYQVLAVATQDTAEAQRLLNLALDISASTTKPLASVTAALSKAYLGNNTALSKLGVGISKADLKAKSFKDITDQLTETFAGSATAATQTFQGSIDKLAVASANAKEVIGTGLIDALQILGGENGIGTVTKAIDELSLGLSESIVSTARLVAELEKLPLVGGFLQRLIGNPLSLPKELLVFGKGGLLDAFRDYGKVAGLQKASDNAHLKSLQNTFKVTAKTTKETTAQLKATQSKIILAKAELALGKGTDVFNMDKIQLQAAEISQAQQLGKVTNQAQLLQITNDLARIKLKQDIIALEDAIASKDETAIKAATAKLNADLGIVGALTGQNLKLGEIKTILDTIAPKDLINIANLDSAIAKLRVISGGGTGTPVSTTAALAQGSFVPIVPGTGGVTGGSASGGNYASSGFPGAEKNNGTVNITVNTGIGDPNAIAEAITDVVRQAVDRGTLRAV
jgi:hypothetical protein